MSLRSAFVKTTLTLFVLGILAGIAGAAGVYYYLIPKLPDTRELQDVKLSVPLRVYTRDGALLAEFGEQRRIPVQYKEIPERLVQAFLSAEDDRFFEHPGVDYKGLLRAGYSLALTGKKKQGGSTITMQVARNFFLSRKKTYLRKLNEILLSFKIEGELSKENIFELYVNKIYLGHRAYGIAAAAHVYYGVTLAELSLPQLAMIAGLPKAPSAYNPISNPPRAKIRRNYVLGRMLKLGYIKQQEYDLGIQAPVVARYHGPKVDIDAGYIAEMVRGHMIKEYGTERTYTEGFKVYTNVESHLQRAAQNGLRSTLSAYDKRHGYRGPEAHIDEIGDTEADHEDILSSYLTLGGLTPALVTLVEEKSARVYLGNGKSVDLDWDSLKWARRYITENRQGRKPKTAEDILQIGDIVRLIPRPANKTKSKNEEQAEPTEPKWNLSQLPDVQGALISLSPKDGGILALVGGFDFLHSKFNRVTQAQRQAGSGFKPFVYSAALEKGFTVASTINDAPVVFNDPSLEGSWRPENYSGKVFGPTRLREALYKSRNLVSIRLLRRVGVDYTTKYLEKVGFDPARLPHNLSLALGSAQVTPLELAAAQSVWANGGYKITPWLIDRIEDVKGQALYTADPITVCEQCPEPVTTDETTLKNAAAKAGSPTPLVMPENAPNHIAPRVIEARNAYLVYTLMRDVVKRGTARRAKQLGRKDLAGKTGTTNEQNDAWFSGYNPNMVTIAWAGFDKMGPLGRGEVGGRVALPAWMAYMKVALEGMPNTYRPQPKGLVRVRIDPKTGKRATPSTPNAVFELFRKEYAPKAGRSTANDQLNPRVSTPSASSQSNTGSSKQSAPTPLEEDSLF